MRTRTYHIQWEDGSEEKITRQGADLNSNYVDVWRTHGRTWGKAAADKIEGRAMHGIRAQAD